jgi:uncharacterized FAD-dependent dehydrogenase
MKKIYKKLVYIGGGVSTQYGVLHLLKNGYDPSQIVIIDKGNDIYNRKPSEVMIGRGGAGTFSDFKVIESWHQGGEFTPKYVDIQTAERLADQLISYIKEYHPDPSKIMYTDIVEEPQWIKDSPFSLKQSTCMHLGTDYGRQQVKNVFEFFDKVGVIQYYNTEVVDIDFEEKTIFCLDLDEEVIKKQGFDDFEISYDKVIIAGGKSGVDFLDKIIKKYNLPTEPRPAQIGVRYETDLKYFEELSKIAYDFKLYKKFDENVSGRSFCTNLYAAFVAPETTYGKISFNGHAYKDPEKYNGLVNFGILLEIKNEIEKPFDFMKDLVGKFNLGGKASHYSPTNRPPSKTDDGEDMPSNPITIGQFKAGYGKYANNILEFIENLNNTFGINDNYIIYLPEIKYFSNTLKFNKEDFSLINHPDVHIQGDNGMSRGIWIAALSGMYVGESFLRN